MLKKYKGLIDADKNPKMAKDYAITYKGKPLRYYGIWVTKAELEFYAEDD